MKTPSFYPLWQQYNTCLATPTLSLGEDTARLNPKLSTSPITRKTNLSLTREGLTTPLTRRVSSICSLCAGTVYIALLGSPTSLITLVSSLREIPTVVVLHHPFLFGEIPT